MKRIKKKKRKKTLIDGARRRQQAITCNAFLRHSFIGLQIKQHAEFR